jgi:hypothetical protein
LKTGDKYWSVIEPIWEKVSIYDGEEIFLTQFSEIPEKIGHLLAAHWCQSEVRNGGFDQFFFNSTGVLAPEAVVGFHAIGMSQTATIVLQAIQRLGEKYSRRRDKRNVQLSLLEQQESIDDPFDDLNIVFFQLVNTEGGGFDIAAHRYAESIEIS